MTATDLDLIRQFARDHSQDAFTTLVNRHVNLIYSAALRQIRSPQLAEEITQSVFADLARNAEKLKPDTVLTAWLYAVARRTAIDVIRKESRRQLREQIAVEMNAMNAADANWNEIEPLLDDALAALDETDRTAILLRYFENKNLREVGANLSLSDDAAQKRVSRAVDRLREFFSKRKITIGASGLAVLISANAVQSAPVGLATTISAGVFAGTAVSAATVIAATKTIAMTTFQKTLITAAFVITAGAGIFEAHQATQLREQNQALKQQQAPLASDLAKLQAENEQLSNLVAEAKDQKALSQAQFNELLKLRGQTGEARTAVQEMAKLKAATARQGGAYAMSFTNAMAQGVIIAEKYKKKDALQQLARMKEKLNLTDDQAQAINDIMMNSIQSKDQQLLNGMLNQQTSQTNSVDEDAEIKSLLTPDQLAAYPDYKQSEVTSAAQKSAKSDLITMTQQMDLSQEQQDEIQSALYQFNLNQTSTSQNLPAIMKAFASGDLVGAANLQAESQKQTLDDKIKTLDGILTPEQLQTYKQSQLDVIDMVANMTKGFPPQTTNGAAQ